MDASVEFRSRVSDMLLPKLTAFGPDLIILSAGFDGIEDDLYHFLVRSFMYSGLFWM
jgi:acetoin utilization deacetylase AcuC-like enzyme